MNLRNRIKGLRTTKLDKLDPFGYGNPKTYTDENEAVLGKSMSRFGYVFPIIARKHPEHAGHLEIIDGHHRYAELLRTGEKSAQVLVVDVDDDQEARELILALQPQADWDMAALNEFIGNLLEDGSTALDIMSFTGLSGSDVELFANSGTDFLDDLTGEETTDHSRGTTTTEHVTFATPLSRDQNEIVHRAIKLAKVSKDIGTKGDAITAICQHYIEAHQ